MSTVLQETAAPFTVNDLPRLARSPMVNKGSRARFDFTDPYTLNGLTSASSIVNGTVLRNLVDGEANLTATGLAGFVAVGPGNLGLVVATANSNPANFLDFGYGNFDMYEAGNHSFIVHMWTKLDASGQLGGQAVVGSRSGNVGNTDVTSPIFGASPAPAVISNGTDGLTFNGYTRGNGNIGQPSLSGGAMAGLHLLSYSWDQGVDAIFLDGAPIASAPGPALVPSFRSHATLTASGNVAAGETVVINGTTITFVAGGATGSQVNVGADAASSLANLRAYINAHRDTLFARAEVTIGQPSTVLTVFRTNASLLTLTETAANLAVSSITTPYGYRLYSRNLKGTTYAIALDDLTVMGATPAEAAAREYQLYRARLSALGIA